MLTISVRATRPLVSNSSRFLQAVSCRRVSTEASQYEHILVSKAREGVGLGAILYQGKSKSIIPLISAQ